MTFINIVTIVCLALMIIGLTTVLIKLIIKKREEKITYIRSFKKGKGVLVYIYAIPLFWLGITYSGQSTLIGFFIAVRRSVDLIVLKYDISQIQALLEVNQLYAFTIYFSFVLVGLNAMLFALSLASQYLWNFFKNLAFRYAKREKLILFGNNEQNYSIYRSEKNRAKIIVDKISDKESLPLYMKNLSFTNVVLLNDYINNIVKECLLKGKKTFAVINTGDDEKNIELSRSFINAILGLDQAKQEKCFNLFRIFVFGAPRYEAIYEDIIENGMGCISYINKYQKIAIDFIDKYPFTKFMNEEHIDYDTSLIREGVEINAMMIGFGKTNQQIFLTSVANNQFITKGNTGVELKKVKYHIFDKDPAENNKNFNHNYSRYKNECSDISQDEYLPLPDYPADEHYYRLDVNDVSFYNEIRRISTASEKDVNFIIIAYGTDLENIDMAKKLVEKSKEWNVKNLTIFVKVRGDHKGQSLLVENNCYFIANENEVVYNIESIIGDRIFKMAQLRNEVYDLEYEITQDSSTSLSEERVKLIKEKANRNWYVKKSQMERDSSLYCCLSLRMKLNLMGLDYCPLEINGPHSISETEYLSIYAQGDMPNYSYYSVKADGKPIIKYNLSFQDSRRKNMAIHEHLRWNSFMISKGIIPATRNQILSEVALVDGKLQYTNGKNYGIRRHGNLTTYDGLVEFRKMVAERDKKEDETLLQAEECKDVIKYDYQLLDDAVWLLKMTGQKIIKKV